MKKPRMSSRLQVVRDAVLTSLWFVPTIMMLGAFGLAAVALWLDLSFFGAGESSAPWWVYVSDSDSARNVLASLLAAMITMASLVFSITMVVLTLAAGQFGPRLIRNFMASVQTQLVLGTFVMTILYCLIVLNAVRQPASNGQAPHSTISFAIALMGISVVLLVLFIHALARSMVSETVIDRVGRELDAILEALEPLRPGTEEGDPEKALPKDFELNAAHFGPEHAGYIQSVEFDRLVEVGRRHKALVGLYFRPGDYVAQGGRGVAIYPLEHDSQELRKAVLKCIPIGVHRTPIQDVEYPVRHLVELAVRALSPGINDPYTAVAVVHRLSASLSQLMGRELPPSVYRDEQEVVRVVCTRPRYSTLIGAAFDQIRQSGADKPIVVIHLIEAILRIAEHAVLPSQLQSLREQLGALVEDAEREIRNSVDGQAIRARATAALSRLNKHGQQTRGCSSTEPIQT